MTIQLRGAPISLPDPLVFSDGERVETTQAWQERRRPELLELFRHNVYGRAPIERPSYLEFEVEARDAFNGAATHKQITMRFAGGRGAIRLSLFTPANLAKPAPCFLLLNHHKDERAPVETDALEPLDSAFWPVNEIIARGYSAAILQLWDVDPDDFDDFQNGVHGIFDPPIANGERASDAWGTIGAWAWGASRAMDYLKSDADVDEKRVAVVGHSRGGKTALWAGAQDERFALVISNNSGCTGAALSRGNAGESIEKINTRFPHWFCARYRTFNGRAGELPIDQHLLLSLIAPRLLYIASAIDDGWADPAAEYATALAATPVYRLFDFEGVNGKGELPPVETVLHDGRIGYHLRAGGHGLKLIDWQRFLDFADRHI